MVILNFIIFSTLCVTQLTSMSLAVVFSLIQKSLWYSNSFYSFVEIAPCGVRGKSMISFNLISIQQRTEFVGINCHDSDFLSATSGVPQGSVLGPLLLLL